jgi:hypothetical protein
MTKLDPIIQQFLEAKAETVKWTAIGLFETALTKKLRSAFQKQTSQFLQRFDVLKDKFPGEVNEVHSVIVFEGTNQKWELIASPEKLNEALKRDELDKDWEPIWDRVSESTSGSFLKPLVDFVTKALTAGFVTQAKEFPLKDFVGSSFDLKFPWAAKYVKEHGADLVTRIDETTKGQIRTIIHQAVDEGWSYNRTSKTMIEQFKNYYSPDSTWAFDAPRPQEHIKDRASLIAVTETGQAYEEGSSQMVQGLSDRGLTVEKSWLDVGDERVCDLCSGNADDGWIPIDEPHSSGDMYPLAHPGDRCTELYRVVT